MNRVYELRERGRRKIDDGEPPPGVVERATILGEFNLRLYEQAFLCSLRMLRYTSEQNLSSAQELAERIGTRQRAFWNGAGKSLLDDFDPFLGPFSPHGTFGHPSGQIGRVESKVVPLRPRS